MGARGVVQGSIIFFSFLAVYFVPANGIECYQCESTNNTSIFQCNEFLTSDIDMTPTSCDNVYGARFCIKHVGRFEVVGSECYQCSSDTNWTCGEGSLTVDTLKPESCDHVHQAQHCIKTVGRYGGGIGTKRFCSSLDLGNYCHYGAQPGDTLTYRTCVYTCSTDGCNPGTVIYPTTITIGVSLLLFYLFQR